MSGWAKKAKDLARDVPGVAPTAKKIRTVSDGPMERAAAAMRAARGASPFSDYPVISEPRWGYGKPPNPYLDAILAKERPAYAAVVDAILADGRLETVPVEASGDLRPHWDNGMFPALDASALYVMTRDRAPSLHLEIGSGNSTRFCRMAIDDHGLDTKIVSVDPQPRVEVDQICDEVIRQPLESVDVDLFDRLGSGDVLFIDGSHRTLMNSDVTMLWTEVFPRLRDGVVVQVHDIFLPYDYPPSWAPRFYSEQYLLAASLLGGTSMRPLFASHYVEHDQDLFEALDRRWAAWGIPKASRGGASFWFEIHGDAAPG